MITKLLTDEDILALEQYSAGAIVAVDLGTFTGGSAIVLAKNAKRVITVDIFENIDMIRNEGSREHYRVMYTNNPHNYQDVKQALEQYKNIEVVQKLTYEYATLCGMQTVDFLFIDADHSFAGVKRDFLAWLYKIKINGVIAFHDSNTDNWDVKEFVWGELMSCHNVKYIETIGSVAVFRRII